jgi:pSer/pThr/pTyr-binding forkhead associated (FHA) protein
MTAAPPRLEIRGAGGILQGVRRLIEPGTTVVVGRSRSCQVSLRRMRGYLEAENPAELLRSVPFRRVSRVHCEIAYLPDSRVEIRDLSQNGTLVDGRRIDRTYVLVPGSEPIRVVLADPAHGQLVLSFRS